LARTVIGRRGTVQRLSQVPKDLAGLIELREPPTQNF
jgi:hypothetical protein